ncbi:hypothetical protein HRG_005954 [Hirsutella rhossiliensis]|uniref:Uncharacterized protein n=1 Tax=Hirsutella rhossiliensis TaxID=111463 RepID=A0A9P8MYA7_9HYPO|nr:uncharacterized protein HRG_05954 [Hirsutella rhossiliensis]KAH0963444.1 hypothetical protein HRG_05954 [Hirsutella rhossiliensis]
MVIGLLAIAAIPTVTGVGQAVSAQKRQNAAAKSQVKFHLAAMVPCQQGFRELGICVLRGGRLVLDVAETQHQKQQAAGHRFCGYYFPYPGPEQHQGLVSTIADDPPMLNWIYVDGQTGAVRHGGRKDTIGHVIGPWGWSDDETWLTLEGGPGGFVARREPDEANGGLPCWVVYWDPAAGAGNKDDDDDDDDGDGEGEAGRQRVVWLRRKPLLGVESRYVRD